MVREPDVIEDSELIPYNIIPYTWPEGNCETLMVHPNGNNLQSTTVNSSPSEFRPNYPI